MKIFSEWMKQKTYRGLIDYEGVDKRVFSSVSNCGKIKHKYKNGKSCKGEKVMASLEVVPELKKHVKCGYFAVLFNSKKVILIFRNKVFEFPRPNMKSNPEFKKAVRYAELWHIPKFYLDELEDTFWLK
jgi:hypothetical protein